MPKRLSQNAHVGATRFDAIEGRVVFGRRARYPCAGQFNGHDGLRGQSAGCRSTTRLTSSSSEATCKMVDSASQLPTSCTLIGMPS